MHAWADPEGSRTGRPDLSPPLENHKLLYVILSLVHMHNLHSGANIHSGCKFAPGVYFGHVNGAL